MLHWIAAKQPVPADVHQVTEHQNAVPNHVNFSGWIVRPANGHFGSAQAMASREKEDLRIETEPLDSLLLEDDSARLTNERFKATLRVMQGQPE